MTDRASKSSVAQTDFAKCVRSAHPYKGVRALCADDKNACAERDVYPVSAPIKQPVTFVAIEPDVTALWDEVPDGACARLDTLSACARAALGLWPTLRAFACEGCGDAFVGHHARRFCDGCGDARHRARMRERMRRIRGTQLAPTSCACGCGAPINATRATRRYASATCRQRAHRRKETT